MAHIQFVSELDVAYHDALASLLFFNPHQSLIEAKIEEAVMVYGTPTIAEENGRLRIHLKRGPQPQTLFALVGTRAELVGVVVYLRVDEATLVVLHVATKDAFAADGIYANALVVPQMLATVRKIAAQIVGVKILTLLYASGSCRDIPVYVKRRKIYD